MRIGVTELILILFLVLILFGAGKLPNAGKALMQSLREFKNAAKDSESEKTESDNT